MSGPRTVLGLAVLVCAASLAGCAQSVSESPPRSASMQPWAWELPHCPAYQAEDYPAIRHRVAAVAGPDGVVTETYLPGWAATAMEQIREVLSRCGSYEHGQDQGAYREQLLVVDTGFAGDESLLVEVVRLTPPAPPKSWYAEVVRSGDVIVTSRRPG